MEQVSVSASDEHVDPNKAEQDELTAFDQFMNDQCDVMDILSGGHEVTDAKTTLFDDFKVFERENAKAAVSALNFDIPDSYVFDFHDGVSSRLADFEVGEGRLASVAEKGLFEQIRLPGA